MLEVKVVTDIDIIAVSALVISIFNLAWNIWEWWCNGPKLRIDIFTDMKENGNFLQKIIDEEHNNSRLFSIKISNIGTWPTTLEFIALEAYKRIIIKVKDKIKPTMVVKDFNRSSANLPCLLKPGEVWNGVFTQSKEIQELLENNLLILVVSTTHRKKPFKKLMIRSTVQSKKVVDPKLLSELEKIPLNFHDIA